MKSASIKNKVQALRARGLTYNGIKLSLGISIPKSTISYWCRDIATPKNYTRNIQSFIQSNLRNSRILAIKSKKKKYQQYISSLHDKNYSLGRLLEDSNVSKLVLAILYLAEGTKKQRSSLTFGNSDPMIIRLFLNLLRKSYPLDESKFRCTLQCRADQNVSKLEKFWSTQTKIPLSRFYKARIDRRSIGKISRNMNYLGVCRLDYFSAHIFHELEVINGIIGDLTII
jgi:hypothetical protein